MVSDSHKRFSPHYLATALIVWAILAFGHGIGSDLALSFFNWARTAGTLDPEGGTAGFARAEKLLMWFFAALFLGVIAWLGWRLRHRPPRLLGEAAIPWVLWATLVYISWKCFILYASELTHFAQYALVGALLNKALEGGGRPQLAFVLTAGLGLADELWQHYGLHLWLLEDRNHWMDWSDLVLNALGAAGGILPFVTTARLVGNQGVSDFRLVKLVLLAAGVFLLPLLLMDPITTSRILGHYPYYPFWFEIDNYKPVHWLSPREGIPLYLCVLLVLSVLVDPKERSLSPAAMAIISLLIALAIEPESRRRGRPVHQEVAHAKVPWIDSTAGLSIDGSLDEAHWDKAPRLGPFLHNSDGKSGLTFFRDGREYLHPLKETYARILWDDAYLYFAFEVEDDDIWIRQEQRDNPYLIFDELISIHLDEGGDEITYYEFGLTPGNVVYDRFNFLPTAPLDYDPWERQIGLPAWDAPGLRTAVKIDGSLEVEAEKSILDRDRGFTAEVAIPWDTFQTTVGIQGNARRKALVPVPGERWRLALYRFERPRFYVDSSEEGAALDAEEARRLLAIRPERFAALIERGILKPIKGENALFAKKDILWQMTQLHFQVQAWSPTYDVWHKPARYGVLEFSRD